MVNKYVWTDNPTVAGISQCNTDVLNDCLMHLKYNNLNDKLTNCILEVPQVVNMHTDGNVLTIKTGTKLYDASNNSLTLNADKTATLTYTNSVPCYVLLAKSTLGIYLISLTDPKLTFSDNKVMYDGTECWLSLGIVTRNVEGKSTVDQVFNGSGYFLNNSFILPNVKGLYPDYRYEDGSLKNGTTIITNVSTVSASYDGDFYLVARGANVFFVPKNLYYYNQEQNMAYRTSDNATLQYFIYAEATVEGGKIIKYNPRYAFRATDYNDFLELRNNSADKGLTNLTNGLANTICRTMPSTVSSASNQKPAVVVQNYLNGDSGYRLWSDNWCEQWGRFYQNTTTVTLLKPYNNIGYNISIAQNGEASASIPRIAIKSLAVNSFTVNTVASNMLPAFWKTGGYIT